jgi:hypothetical protein
MELKQILDRFADGLHYVDATSEKVNSNKKTGKYKAGLTQLYENQARDELVILLPMQHEIHRCRQINR